MFKEKMPTREEIFSTLMRDFKLVVEQWTELSGKKQTEAGNDEGTVRNLEKKSVAFLIDFLKRNPEFVEKNIVDLEFIGQEYLRYGDCSDLMKEFADVVGLEYHDMFGSGAAKQILNEIGERVDDDKKYN